MRISMTTLAVVAGLMGGAPSIARAQNPSQLLQGLLSGNQNQDQAVREAYERGYRQGRADQTRDERAGPERDRRPQQRGQYPDQDQQGYPQRNPYNR